MMAVNPETLMSAGIALLVSLKAKETSLPCFVLLVRKDNGKLLLTLLLLKTLFITMA
jgi:hypothetical protein